MWCLGLKHDSIRYDILSSVNLLNKDKGLTVALKHFS